MLDRLGELKGAGSPGHINEIAINVDVSMSFNE
jgi:hypothetical protein